VGEKVPLVIRTETMNTNRNRMQMHFKIREQVRHEGKEKIHAEPHLYIAILKET
jgi:hypothetical protein